MCAMPAIFKCHWLNVHKRLTNFVGSADFVVQRLALGQIRFFPGATYPWNKL
jgi:hypothetical protein